MTHGRVPGRRLPHRVPTTGELLDEIATEYKDKLRVAKIDIESNPQTPPRIGIRNIPTLIMFKNGTVEAQKVGSVRKPDLKSLLDAHL